MAVRIIEPIKLSLRYTLADRGETMLYISESKSLGSVVLPALLDQRFHTRRCAVGKPWSTATQCHQSTDMLSGPTIERDLASD